MCEVYVIFLKLLLEIDKLFSAGWTLIGADYSISSIFYLDGMNTRTLKLNFSHITFFQDGVSNYVLFLMK